MKKTWPEIWLEIAEAYWRAPSRRTNRQDDLTGSGFCLALSITDRSISDIFNINNDDKYLNSVAMLRKLNTKHGSGYWDLGASCESQRSFEILRAQFAEHMAGMPHEDFEEFIK